VAHAVDIATRTRGLYEGFGGRVWGITRRVSPLWELLGWVPWGCDIRAAERAVDAFTEDWEVGVVLDLPVGVGRMFPRYASTLSPSRVIAADLSSDQLGRARVTVERTGMLDRTEFVAADVVALPLPDASVDAILTEGGFHHFPDRPAAMREFMRVLRPGGHIAGYGLVTGENRRGSFCLRASHRAGTVAEPMTAAEMRACIAGAGAADWREFRTGSMLCFSVRKAASG
jgi:SAM-dependent methyltransferase